MTPPRCIRCGGLLAAVARHPSTPPWWCGECRLLWWNEELTQAAQRSYVAARHHFRPGKPIREAVRQEAEVAAQRGTSVRPEHLEHLTRQQLETLAERRLTTDAAAAVAERLKGEP